MNEAMVETSNLQVKRMPIRLIYSDIIHSFLEKYYLHVVLALAALTWFIAPKELKFSDPAEYLLCLLYTSPSPRDKRQSRMPSSA